jgi:hypothetical protein
VALPQLLCGKTILFFFSTLKIKTKWAQVLLGPHFVFFNNFYLCSMVLWNSRKTKFVEFFYSIPLGLLFGSFCVTMIRNIHCTASLVLTFWVVWDWVSEKVYTNFVAVCKKFCSGFYTLVAFHKFLTCNCIVTMMENKLFKPLKKKKLIFSRWLWDQHLNI